MAELPERQRAMVTLYYGGVLVSRDDTANLTIDLALVDQSAPLLDPFTAFP